MLLKHKPVFTQKLSSTLIWYSNLSQNFSFKLFPFILFCVTVTIVIYLNLQFSFPSVAIMHKFNEQDKKVKN